ncbi:MAG: CDP-2,3-bis-(O-geranylgeranyl)-sn-glycerol synthase [Candidatus Bathyarchaeia archaeon]
MDLTLIIIEALKFVFPAYCANAVPVIVGGGPPLDFGRSFPDGRPVFGKNKTFRGFFSGLAVGAVAGLAETAVFGFQSFPALLGVLLSFGALMGDLMGAFLKRRIGLAPGELLPVIDQTDFIIGALLLSLPVSLPLLSWEIVLTVLIITPPVHLLTNFAAYKLGLKRNPW